MFSIYYFDRALWCAVRLVLRIVTACCVVRWSVRERLKMKKNIVGKAARSSTNNSKASDIPLTLVPAVGTRLPETAGCAGHAAQWDHAAR